MAMYTLESAAADPLVIRAVHAATANIQAPVAALQAAAMETLDRAMEDAKATIEKSAKEASEKMEEIMKISVHKAAVQLVMGIQGAMERKQNDSMRVVERRQLKSDCGYAVVAPEFLTQCDGTPRLCKASSAIIQNPMTRYDAYMAQAWDCYGDCVVVHVDYKHGKPPFNAWHTKQVPIVGLRAKLTPEYQEILWHVAQKMDASYLRDIFDKYHPCSSEIEQLQRLKLECAKKEELLVVRENDCILREARLGDLEKELKENALREANESVKELLQKNHHQELCLSAREQLLAKNRDASEREYESATLRLKAAKAAEVVIAIKEENVKASEEQLLTTTEANRKLASFALALKELIQELSAIPELPAPMLTKCVTLLAQGQ